MGLFSKPVPLNWIQLTTKDQLNEALASSSEQPVLFFKHSTRCSISTMALSRFESNWNKDAACKIYFLDLITYREISNLLAEKTHVVHQSPQVIVVANDQVIYTETHNGIRAQEILTLI